MHRVYFGWAICDYKTSNIFQYTSSFSLYICVCIYFFFFLTDLKDCWIYFLLAAKFHPHLPQKYPLLRISHFLLIDGDRPSYSQNSIIMNLSPLSSCAAVSITTNANKYSCKECGDVFSDEKSLELHNRIHVMSRDLEQVSSRSPFSSSFSPSPSNLFVNSMTAAVGTSGTFSRMPMTTNESICAEVLANIIDLHGRNKNQSHQVRICDVSSQEVTAVESVSNDSLSAMNISSAMFFKCSSCDKNFSNQESLDTHVKSHQIHGAKCEEVLADIIVLHTKNKAKEAEMFSATGKVPHNSNICKYVFCGSTFTDKSSLDTHSRIHHQPQKKLQSPTKEFKCTFCKEEFCSIASLKAHTKNHNKEFKYNDVLGFVSLNSSSKKPVIRGTKCSQSSPNKKNYLPFLTAHKNVFQSGKEENNSGVQVTLDARGSTSQNRPELKRTSKEAFAISIGLSTSSKRKKYKCTSCKEAFEDVASLKNHSASHRSSTSSIDSDPSNASDFSKFKCTFCNEDFVNLITLDNHNQSHTECRNSYKCGYCGVKFSKFDTFREHVRVHIKKEHSEKFGGRSLSKNKTGKNIENDTKEQCGSKEEANGTKLATETRVNKETSLVKNTRRHTANVTNESGKTLTTENSNVKVTKKQESSAATDTVTAPSIATMVTTTNSVAGSTPGSTKDSKNSSNNSQNTSTNSNFTPRVKFVTPRTLFKCSYCNKEFPKPGKLKRHIRIHTGEKPYKCPHCQKCFTQSGNLTHHLRTHNGDKPYVCNICNKSFSQSSSLTIHNRIHTGERPFACYYCDKRFSHSGPLNHHIRTHTGEKPFKCQFCEKAFPQSSQLRQHVRTHTGERPYKCHQCLKNFTHSSSLNIHLRLHRGENSFKCQHCEKSFAQSGKLHQHLKGHTAEKNVKCPWPSCTKQVLSGKMIFHLWTHMTKITDEQHPLKCDICDRVFKQVSNLSRHLRLHTGEKVYECKKCEKVFTQANKLSVHLKSAHAGGRPYKCRFCIKTCLGLADLTLHERTHTRGKLYSCDICHRKFSQTGSLSCHCCIHTGLRLLQCKVCEKTFSLSNGLAQHMKMHTKEKPYSCKHCGKAFSFSSKLKEHLTIHTNEKPFHCKICSKQFRSSSNFSNHKKHCSEAGNNTNKTETSPTAVSSKTNKKSFYASRIQTSQTNSITEMQVVSQSETVTSTVPTINIQANSLRESALEEDIELKPNLSSFTDSELAHIYTFTVSVIGDKNNAVISSPTIESCLENPSQVLVDSGTNLNTIVSSIDSHLPSDETLSTKLATATTTTTTTTNSSQVDIFVSGNEEVSDTERIQVAIPQSSENVEGLALLEQEVRCSSKDQITPSANVEKGTVLDSCSYVIQATLPTIDRNSIACSEESDTNSTLQTTVPSSQSSEDIQGGSMSNLDLAVSVLESKSSSTDEVYQNNHVSDSNNQRVLEMQTFISNSSCKEPSGSNQSAQKIIQRTVSQQEIGSDSSIVLQNSVPLRSINLIENTSAISTVHLPKVNTVTLDARGSTRQNRPELKRTSKEAFAISIGLSTSSKRKKYKCTSCKEAFEDVASLKNHSASHRSSTSSIDSDPSNALDFSKFKCTFCNEDFVNLITLDNHTKSHTECRNSYKCGYCSVKFSKFDTFREHVRVHIKKEHSEKFSGRSLSKNKTGQNIENDTKEQCGSKEEANGTKLATETRVNKETSLVKNTRRHTANVTNESGKTLTTENSNVKVTKKQESSAATDTVAAPSIATMVTTTNSVAGSTPGSTKDSKNSSNNSQNTSTNSNFTPRVKFVTPRTLFKCSYCNKEFPKPGKLKRHIRIHTGEKPYKCPHCQKCFTQSGNLTHHLRTHNGDKPYVCNICNKSFSQSSSLTIHNRIHTGERPFACSYCDKRFSHSGPLNHHIRTHTGEKPFKCQFCEKAFPQSSQLRQHVRTHTGERPYKCHQCLKNFTQSSSLNIHMRSHTGEKPFKCQHCEKSFAQSGKLHQHLKVHTAEKNINCPWPSCTKQVLSGKMTHHLWTHMAEMSDGKQPLKCDICDKVFKQVSNLSQHLRLHTGEKVYECKKCEKVFTQANKLSIHLKSAHAGERPYKCRFCIKAFPQPADLTLHERTHTGEKPYSCDICHRKFSQTGSLSRHRRIHTGEKPFHCEMCEKAFSQSSGLAQHMKTHTQEKPYSCKHCGKAFSFSSKLREHLTIHTNEKPFRCKICSKQFRSSSNLSNHKKHCSEAGNNTNKTETSPTAVSSKTNKKSFPASKIQTSQTNSITEMQVVSQSETVTSTVPTINIQANSLRESALEEDIELKPNLSSFTDSELAHIYTFTVSVIGDKNNAVTSSPTIESCLENPSQVLVDSGTNLNTIVSSIDSHLPSDETLSTKLATATTTTTTTTNSSQVDIFVSGNEEVSDTERIQVAIPQSSENVEGLALLEQEVRCSSKDHITPSANVEKGTVLDSCSYVIQATLPTIDRNSIACSEESDTNSTLQTTVPSSQSSEDIQGGSMSNLDLAVSVLESKSSSTDEVYQNNHVSDSNNQRVLEMQTFISNSSCKEPSGSNQTAQKIIQRTVSQQEIGSDSSIVLQNSVPLRSIHLIENTSAISTVHLPTVYKVSYSLATQGELENNQNINSATSDLTNLTTPAITINNNSNNDVINSCNHNKSLFSVSCPTSSPKAVVVTTVEETGDSSSSCKDFLSGSLTEEPVTGSHDAISTSLAQPLMNFHSEADARISSPYH